MSGYYSKYQPYELEGFIDDLVSKKFKLADKINQFDKTIQKETIWLKSTTDTHLKLKEIILNSESMKKQYNSMIDKKDKIYQIKKDTLIQELKEQEELDIAKIKQKYQQKYDNIDSVVEGHMTNDNRKVEALGKKIQVLEASISKKREKLMEEKKSKIIINAESEKAIIKNEMDEADKNIAEIRTELTRRRH